GAAGTPTGAEAGAEGIAAGTSATPASTRAGSAGGAACSLFHSIHSSTATISQARIRKVRVWFIGQAGSFAVGTRRVGGRRGCRTGVRGRHCAVRGRGRQRTGTSQQRAAGLAERGRGRLGGRWPRHQDVVARRQERPQQAEVVAQDAADAVAHHGAPVDLARNRQAQARDPVAGAPVQGEQGQRDAASVAEDAVEVGARPDPRRRREARLIHASGGGTRSKRGPGTDQADRRLRPLARRRARILRPSAVAMRARKPWSRLRLRLLGWKVRLVAMAEWVRQAERTGDSSGARRFGSSRRRMRRMRAPGPGGRLACSRHPGRPARPARAGRTRFLVTTPMDAWPRCLERLEAELPAEDVHTWLRPLQARRQDSRTVLYAPNAFVRDEVESRYLQRIRELLAHFGGGDEVALE